MGKSEICGKEIVKLVKVKAFNTIILQYIHLDILVGRPILNNEAGDARQNCVILNRLT